MRTDGPSAVLPAGVIELARSLWRSSEALAAPMSAATTTRSDAELDHYLDQLLKAPLRLEPDWPNPTEAWPVSGGWVHVEVVDEDLETLDALAPAWSALGPEDFAAAAQEMRLPVTPYRAITGATGLPAPTQAPTAAAPRAAEATTRALSDAVVIDLSSHWAGPLATKLLAEAGATVIKIDPDCRPDGFRDRASLYRHLNGSKTIEDLDLRSPRHRSRFEALLADADLVVESFSRRVMPNLGYGTDRLWQLSPRLSLLSIKAFPAGSPEQDWLAFGPGVHAASGLGLAGCRPLPAPVAYADLLAGLTGFGRALALLLTDRNRQAEISLSAAIGPLVERARYPGPHGEQAEDHG